MDEFKHARFAEKEYSTHIVKLSAYYSEEKMSFILLIYDKKTDTYSIKHFNTELETVNYVKNNYIKNK